MSAPFALVEGLPLQIAGKYAIIEAGTERLRLMAAIVLAVRKVSLFKRGALRPLSVSHPFVNQNGAI